MTLSSSAKTNYLRGAIYDEHTGLTSPWTLLAEIKPVYDFEAPAINCVNSFSSESTSLFALISQTTITITMYRPACGSAWLGHYRVGTSDSGSYVTVSYPADKEVSTVILTKQNLSGSETNWYVSAYSSCASTQHQLAKTVESNLRSRLRRGAFLHAYARLEQRVLPMEIRFDLEEQFRL
jgi:hypothetical protein